MSHILGGLKLLEHQGLCGVCWLSACGLPKEFSVTSGWAGSGPRAPSGAGSSNHVGPTGRLTSFPTACLIRPMGKPQPARQNVLNFLNSWGKRKSKGMVFCDVKLYDSNMFIKFYWKTVILLDCIKESCFQVTRVELRRWLACKI